MLYAFILGRTFTLSIAEIFAVLRSFGLNPEQVAASPEVFLVNLGDSSIGIAALQKRLGGTVKIAVLQETCQYTGDPLESASAFLRFSKLQKMVRGGAQTDKKISLGVSVYLLDDTVRFLKTQGQNVVQKFGLSLKRTIKQAGSSVRVVLPEGQHRALSSATVWHNHLFDGKGTELNILIARGVLYFATTLTVQDFEDYGRRDFQRPVRDMHRGLTPPKLAQLMVNLLGKTDNIWDPFCGLGTFLQEGLLLGNTFFGSDIDEKAVSGSEVNLEWLCRRYGLPPAKFKLQQGDASVLVPPMPISGIVTEGTLGPPLSEFPTSENIEKIFSELTSLYTACFAHWYSFLPEKSRVVMCLPAYRKNDEEYVLFPNLDFALKNRYTVVDLISPDFVENWSFLRLTNRKTGIYDRKDQIVAREIVVFEKA